MMSRSDWRSMTTIRYAHGEGPVVLEFIAETGRFEYRLPGGELPMIYDATSFEDVHRLKDRLEATLASAQDIRGGVAFVDRHATPSH